MLSGNGVAELSMQYSLVVPLSASDLPLNKPRNSLLSASLVYGCGLCNKDGSACGCSCALWTSRFEMVRAESFIEKLVYNSPYLENSPDLVNQRKRDDEWTLDSAISSSPS